MSVELGSDLHGPKALGVKRCVHCVGTGGYRNSHPAKKERQLPPDPTCPT
jgi:hypothetical protein